ncbi:hypothetical protein ASE01_12020 [Nocardioides sp. Root190]|uniref:hypothetical protein n=1 Tax=Nocardioides sp. Root190 TaxID=1736488 RepID=UPI0006F2B6A2|nr:hypothetical protein [Nocardioides sp. Root190]KRB75785.1 hypothetical protein ASE01_12020 [Nocardioides sp. Root190]
MTLVAVDLDRTLIFSPAALGPLADDATLRVVEMYDGAPLSRMTDRSWQLLTELMDRSQLVPVTTRSTLQYQRVELPRVPAFALCTNGGTLLVNGRPDPLWRAESLAIAAESAPLAEVADLFGTVADEPWVKLVRDVEDLFTYLVAVERSAIPVGWAEELTGSAERLGWRVSVQGRKIYAVPSGISKESGVVRLRRHLGSDGPVFAAGDSLLDAGMLIAADHAIRPAHGELHDVGWAGDGVTVTGRAGVLAGEDVLDWLLSRSGHS